MTRKSQERPGTAPDPAPLAVLAAVLLVAPVLAVHAASRAEVNLIDIPNPSFEEDSDWNNFPDGWWSNNQWKFSLSDDSRHGAKSLKVDIGNWDTWFDATINLPVHRFRGAGTVSVGVWAKVNGSQGWLSLIFKRPDGGEDKTELWNFDGNAGSYDWKWLTKEKIAVPAEFTEVKLFLQLNGSWGTMQLDRLVIARGTELPPETITTSDNVASNIDLVKAAITSARAAIKDGTAPQLTAREAVSEKKELADSLVTLMDELIAEAKDFADRAAREEQAKPLKARKAREAVQASHRAKNLILDAIKSLEEAKKDQDFDTAEGKERIIAAEELSSAKVDAALRALEEARLAIVELEAGVTNPLTLAGTWGLGIWKLEWKKEDNKWKWIWARADQILRQPYVEYLAAAPNGDLYCGGVDDDLYRSEDNGATWTWTPTGLPGKGTGLVIDPGQGENWLLTTWGNGTWWSETMGRGWTKASAPSLFVRAPLRVKEDDARKAAYYAIADGNSIIKAAEFLGAWKEFARLPDRVKGWQMAVKPHTRDVLLVATDLGLAEVKPDGKVSFVELGVTTSDARSVTVIDDRVLVGTAGDGIVEWKIPAPGDRGTAEARDYKLENGNVFALGVSDHPKPAFAVQVIKPPVPRFWTPRSGGLYNLIVLDLAINPKNEEILYCITLGGFYKSLDRGESWTRYDEGLTMATVNRARIVVDPSNPENIYLSTSYFGAANSAGMLFKSTDGGVTWQRKDAGLNPTIFDVAVNPGATWEVYLNTLTAGTYKSWNGGDSWSELKSGLTDQFGVSIRQGAADPKTLFAGTIGKLFRWENDTWVDSSEGLTGSIYWAPAQDPFDGNTWLLGTLSSGLFKTENGGKAWRKIDRITTQEISWIAYRPDKRGVVYLGSRSAVGLPTGAGVLRSVDGGESWIPDNDGLTSLYVTSVTVSPSGVVYATTLTGVYYKQD